MKLSFCPFPSFEGQQQDQITRTASLEALHTAFYIVLGIADLDVQSERILDEVDHVPSLQSG
jgi:hypothetical protein